MADDFDTAHDLYDACESETLNHTDVVEALAEALESAAEPDETNAAVFARICPLTVVAYKRADPPSDHTRQCCVESMVESLEEWWFDEWGNPDDVEAEKVPEAVTALRAAVDLWCSKQTVWSCNRVAERVYTAEEALAIVGEDNA